MDDRKHIEYHQTIVGRMMICDALFGCEFYSANPIKRFMQKIGIVKKDKISADEFIKISEAHINDHREKYNVT